MQLSQRLRVIGLIPRLSLQLLKHSSSTSKSRQASSVANPDGFHLGMSFLFVLISDTSIASVGADD